MPMPRAIQLYNSNMGGVDLNNMVVQLNRLPTRARKWYTPLIGYMIDLSLINSWLIYRRHAKALGDAKCSMGSKEFRLSVSKSLRGAPKLPNITVTKKLIKQPRSLRPDARLRFEGQHSPIYENVQARCKHCSEGKTKVKCPICQVYLCFTPVRNCFLVFHTCPAA